MLESVTKEAYSGDYDSAILEQWKTCVEQANSNTDKRNSSNGLFITINAALFAVITFTWDYKSILLAIVGVVVCILWINMIQSYQQLSHAKYDIINEIEKRLPLAPFAHEWEKLKLEQNYIGLTRIEKVIPWLFLVLYALSIIYPLVKLLLNILCPCFGGAS